MPLPRTLNPLTGMPALFLLGLPILPVHAQTLFLDSGDNVTVTGTGTVGTINNASVDNSTSSYASPAHGLFTGGGNAVTLNNTASLTLGSGGTAVATSQGDNGVFARGSGAFTLNGGTISSGSTSTYGLSVIGSSPITISSGTISVANNDTAIYAYGTGPVTVTGGTLTAGYGGIGLASGNSSPVTVSGGSITGGGYGIYSPGSGLVTISGGTINGGSNGVGPTAGLQTGTGAVNVSGGTIKGGFYGIGAGTGPVTITGGSISGTNGLATASGSSVTILGGTITGQSDVIYASGSGSNVTIAGGTLSSSTGVVTTAVYAGSGSTVTISGGNLSGGLYNAGQSGAGLEAQGGTINLFSLENTPFLINGVPMNNLTLGQYLSGTDTISGTLTDGSKLALTFENIGGTINLNVGSPPSIPEASTTISFGLLLALGLGGIIIAKGKKTAAAA